MLGSLFSGLFKLLYYLFFIVLVGYLLWRYHAEVLEALRNLIQAIRDFWANLFGGGEAAEEEAAEHDDPDKGKAPQVGESEPVRPVAGQEGEDAELADQEAEIGRVYTGRVVRITNFGAFVEILPGTDGLVHISQLANYRVKKVTDIVKEGDNLSSIADQFRVPLRALLIWNRPDIRRPIHPGDRLVIHPADEPAR